MRNRPGLNDIENPIVCLNRLLEDQSKPLLLHDISHPKFALLDIVSVTIDIEYFEQSFIASRLRRSGKGFKAVPEEAPPSRTELRRIRRGFWPLQLLCDLSRPTPFGLARIETGGILSTSTRRHCGSLKRWSASTVVCANSMGCQKTPPMERGKLTLDRYFFFANFSHTKAAGQHGTRCRGPDPGMSRA